jgi:hypothetical protein
MSGRLSERWIVRNQWPQDFSHHGSSDWVPQLSPSHLMDSSLCSSSPPLFPFPYLWAAIPCGSRGPDPHFLLVWGSTCTWTPTFLVKSAFFKSKCALIYCDNNLSEQLVTTASNPGFCCNKLHCVFITVVVNPFDPVYS